MEIREEFGLNERSREILQWAISTYIATSKPVGSRKLARRSREHLSAATVRNIMADLEEMGYLRQPHASAGRVPTDKGYRVYVDYLLEKREITSRERELIDRTLQSEDTPAHLMHRTSQVLSHVSKHLGIVVSPPISRVALQHIQFVRLTENRILVILVSRSGIVQNRIIHPAEEFSQTELDQAARYIVEHFKNKTLLEIKALITKIIQEEQAIYDKFVRRVIMLSTQTFSEAEDDAQLEIYLDGAANLIKIPEFSDISKMTAFFEAIEHKSRLASLITECIKGDSEEVKITIGAENALPGIEDCTLITSRYVVDETTHGSLGILGPTRMEYGRAISLVEYVARLFGRVLRNQGTGE
jgi:heat-inducible transcriptional repressor